MIEVVACRQAHLRALAPRLRAEERFELAAAGEAARHNLHDRWWNTLNPWAATADGKVLACWGDEAGILATEGLLWFASSDAVERVPFALARMAKWEVEGMLFSRETVRTSIHKSCTRALRFARMLGFRESGNSVMEGFVDMRVTR